ncbi:cyclase, partial [Campylobacter coli]|nr:cyclase [Campylobacter coli]
MHEKYRKEIFMKNNFIYLSYFLDQMTPTYGNKEKIKLIKKSSIEYG